MLKNYHIKLYGFAKIIDEYINLLFKNNKFVILNLKKCSTHVPLKTIGFVPTMGALHEGHLSLIEKSKNDNDLTVCSIFVNPTQFNNAVDFEKYPKTVDQDVNLLKKVGCNIVFIPTIETIYPEGLTKKKYDFKGLDLVMEGKFRLGHFDGVAEVVLRLFDLIKPQKAYFGEKDFQQLQIIRWNAYFKRNFWFSNEFKK